MNLVGKIFVVLILVASTVFMTMGLMVFATHRNWQEEVMGSKAAGVAQPGWKKRLDDARAEQMALNAENNRLQTLLATERKAHTEMLAKAENQRQILADTNAKLETDKQAQAKRLDDAVADMKQSQDVLAAQRKENTGLRDDIRLANKATDEQFKKATALEDKLHIALGQLADLKGRNELLATSVAKAKLLLPPGVTLDDPVDKRPPTVRGEVLAVDQENRIEISLGSDDGLREGHTLEVFRDSKYLGRMQVLETHPHRAVGKILKEYQQDVIRTGDEVATRFKA